MSEKKTIVFILSSDHSGSTILDLCLGNHPECSSLGEISHLQEGIDLNTYCVCGSEISQCDYWNSVKNYLKDKNDICLKEGGDFTLNKEAPSYYSKIKLYLKIIGLGSLNVDWINNMANLYEALLATGGVKILIDSSKGVMRALIFHKKSKNINVKFLHLVRDVRGVAYSCSKKHFKVKLPGKELIEKERAGLQVLSIEDTCNKWVIYNKRVSMLLKFFVPEQDIMRVRYEDLCSQPDSTLKSISNWLNLGQDINLTEFKSGKHHNIGGNPTRFNSSGLKSADDIWKEALSEKQQELCLQIAGKLSNKYGYN